MYINQNKKTMTFSHVKAQVVLPLLLFCIAAVCRVSAQDTTGLSGRIIDMKLQLIEARQTLTELKLEMLEMKPQQSDSILRKRVDSLVRAMEWRPPVIKDTVVIKPVKTVISWNLAQIFEGTLQLGYERALRRNLSYEIALSGTYATMDGIGGFYVKDQNFSMFNSVTNEYTSYAGEMIRALGVTARLKNYLLARVNNRIHAPIGLYAAPQLMYRRVWITGRRYDYDVKAYKDVTANLDIFHGGVIIGGKFTIAKVVSVDLYAGGVMRLAKYFNASSLTKYKKWYHVDYSGVLPTAGINLGIVK
jgi:hypothetical protein